MADAAAPGVNHEAHRPAGPHHQIAEPREKVVAGGSEITVYIGPLKPGRYEFFGDFNPDTARAAI